LSALDKDGLRIVENSLEGEAARGGEAHTHPWAELLFFQTGECEMSVEDKSFRLRRNQLLIIPAATRHAAAPGPGKCRNLMLAIPPGLLSLNFAAGFGETIYKRPLRLDLMQAKFVRGVFAKIADEERRADRYSDEMRKSLLLELFVYLARSFGSDPAFEKEASLADDITRYLLEHYAEDLNQKDVAQRFYLSRSYLSKIFKAKTGRGFNEYLTHIRIEQAKAMLKTTAMPVTEIAFACGFNDSNYFSKIFKKLEGVTPLNYRNSE